MTRLYNFFFLLFIILFAISFIYGTLISWTTYKILQPPTPNQYNYHLEPVSFLSFIKIGLIQALLYSLVLILFIVFLLKKSFTNGKKFSVRDILFFTGWFFLIT